PQGKGLCRGVLEHLDVEEGGFEGGSCACTDFAEGESHVAGVSAEDVHSGFYAHRVAFEEEALDQLEVAKVDLAGGFAVARGRGIDKIADLARDDVGGDGDDAGGADGHHGEGERVVARQHGEVAPAVGCAQHHAQFSAGVE